MHLMPLRTQVIHGIMRAPIAQPLKRPVPGTQVGPLLVRAAAVAHAANGDEAVDVFGEAVVCVVVALAAAGDGRDQMAEYSFEEWCAWG